MPACRSEAGGFGFGPEALADADAVAALHADLAMAAERPALEAVQTALNIFKSGGNAG
jgi:hypothetical protein